MSTGCGSEDSTRKERETPGSAGAGGASETGGAETGGQRPEGGVGGSAALGGAGGQQQAAGAGEGGGGGSEVVGASGAAGAAGAGTECAPAEPATLEGAWTVDCGTYTCQMNIAASGALSVGCQNGQYESGTLSADGAITTAGEGGAYDPFSTKGTLAASDCESMTWDFIGQTPPQTGPEEHFVCQLSRSPACAATLLETLAGTWNTTCGTSTCATTFTAAGEMSNACSNGQQSSGTVDETGAFSDLGSGGNYPDYSTAGVIALDGCDTFLMPYTYQIPPNQGTKHPQQCTYTRQH